MRKIELNITPISEWLGTNEPLIICGPCSAESFDQTIRTALEIDKIKGVNVFRAGIWKPRTRPKGFEGQGSLGLEWLKEVKSSTKLLTTTEVASASHVEEAINAGVDILWLGARTVVNPFLVSEIANAIKGHDIPVLIKNPIHPEVDLWIGAIERIYNAGVRKIVAVHRGFYYYKNDTYRNNPMWEIVVELKRLIPNLPIICDPSHIAGKRELVQNLAQKALDFGMVGLMIETHIDPDNALTDSKQQVSPAQLEIILNNLKFRNASLNVEDNLDCKLEDLRNQIDKLDAELLDILNKRFSIVKEIGHYKKDNNIAILQIKRWRNILKQRIEIGNKMNYDLTFLRKLIELIHQESIRLQEDIFNNKEK